jgi:hypothetical protein
MSKTASAGARYRIGAYGFWHRHAAILLAEARPGCDADVLSHTLLAAMGAEAAGVLKERYGQARAVEGITALAAALVAA